MKPWNPSPRVKAFLAGYIASGGSITRAAKAAGIDRSAHYRLMERQPEYVKAFEAAGKEATDVLIDEMTRRGKEGVRKLVLYHGEPVMVPTDLTKRAHKKTNPKIPLYETEYSDQMLLSKVKAKAPEFRDRVSAELAGKDGGPIDSRLEIVFVKSPAADGPKDES